MNNMTLIAGPCVIESMEVLEVVAEKLVQLKEQYGLDIIFKSSFDKANRPSISSYRGPGLEKGMQMLADIKKLPGRTLGVRPVQPGEKALERRGTYQPPCSSESAICGFWLACVRIEVEACWRICSAVRLAVSSA